MIRIFSLQADGERLISPHFRVKDFACKDGSDKIAIDRDLCELLEDLREAAGGRRVRIVCGYRTERHNRRVRGSRSSMHMIGRAADVIIEGLTLSQTARLAEQCFARSEVGGGIGLYEGGYCHIDIRTARARWRVTRHRERYEERGFFS